MPPSLVFTEETWKEFRAICEKTYPNEGCGLLTGRLTAQSADKKAVQRIIAMSNTLLEQGRGRFDFAFSPKEFMEHQMAAEAASFDVVGLYHTHPDHPPRPSPTDAAQPMLSGWINVIASVYGGKFKDAKAWWREDDKDPFLEIQLTIGAL